MMLFVTDPYVFAALHHRNKENRERRPNVKKSLSAFAVVGAISLAVFGTWGCGGGDDSSDNGGGGNNDPIVIASVFGNWSLTGIEQNGVTAPSPYVVNLTIRSDGTLTWTVNGESVEGTYTKTTSMLVLTFPANPAMNQSHQYWLGNGTLTLQMDVGNKYIFTKI